MGVAVDQAGNGHHTGAVHNGFRLLFGRGLADGDDLSVLDADIGTEQNFHFGISLIVLNIQNSADINIYFVCNFALGKI